MILEDATREQLFDEVCDLRRLLMQAKAHSRGLREQLARTAARPPTFSKGSLDDSGKKDGHNGRAKPSPQPRDLALALLDKVPALIWRSGIDAKCDYFNETWLEFTGRTLEQELGDGWTEGVHPEDVERCLQSSRGAIDNRQPFSIEYRLRRHDGQYRWIVDHGRPFLDLDGKFAGYIGSCYECIKGNQSEQALARSEAMLAEAQQIAHLGSWNWDIVSDRVTWSEEHYRIFGLKPQEMEMTYERFLSRVYPDDQQTVRTQVEQAFRDHNPYQCCMRILHEDGTVRVVQSRGEVVFDENTKPVRMFGTVQDITEEKHTEEQLCAYDERVQALSRQLLTTQEQERRHLARELHDEFGQVLAAINFQIHAAKSLGKDALSRLHLCTTLLQQATEQIRNLAQDLRPRMLDKLGLEAALRCLVDRHWEHTGCAVQFSWRLVGAQLSPDLASACYRVVQEALTNVVRHAKARNVWIELRETEGVMELNVRDDGLGFDVLPTERWAARRGSLGLLGMGERVSTLGGRLSIQSTPGRGTRICATLPLTPDLVQPAGP
ncbi:hypothetical protein AYO44_17030 [Planctomycetaceae bacterium SCGC AG-212-F19]|nr:hypothetical protein AYO44_17030 [Planctomycetaceae bacterium SCGC AG-212-F19]